MLVVALIFRIGFQGPAELDDVTVAIFPIIEKLKIVDDIVRPTLFAGRYE